MIHGGHGDMVTADGCCRAVGFAPFLVECQLFLPPESEQIGADG